MIRSPWPLRIAGSLFFCAILAFAGAACTRNVFDVLAFFPFLRYGVVSCMLAQELRRAAPGQQLRSLLGVILGQLLNCSVAVALLVGLHYLYNDYITTYSEQAVAIFEACWYGVSAAIATFLAVAMIRLMGLRAELRQRAESAVAAMPKRVFSVSVRLTLGDGLKHLFYVLLLGWSKPMSLALPALVGLLTGVLYAGWLVRPAGFDDVEQTASATARTEASAAAAVVAGRNPSSRGPGGFATAPSGGGWLASVGPGPTIARAASWGNALQPGPTTAAVHEAAAAAGGVISEEAEARTVGETWNIQRARIFDSLSSRQREVVEVVAEQICRDTVTSSFRNGPEWGTGTGNVNGAGTSAGVVGAGGGYVGGYGDSCTAGNSRRPTAEKDGEEEGKGALEACKSGEHAPISTTPTRRTLSDGEVFPEAPTGFAPTAAGIAPADSVAAAGDAAAGQLIWSGGCNSSGRQQIGLGSATREEVGGGNCGGDSDGDAAARIWGTAGGSTPLWTSSAGAPVALLPGIPEDNDDKDTVESWQRMLAGVAGNNAGSEVVVPQAALSAYHSNRGGSPTGSIASQFFSVKDGGGGGAGGLTVTTIGSVVLDDSGRGGDGGGPGAVLMLTLAAFTVMLVAAGMAGTCVMRAHDAGGLPTDAAVDPLWDECAPDADGDSGGGLDVFVRVLQQQFDYTCSPTTLFVCAWCGYWVIALLFAGFRLRLGCFAGVPGGKGLSARTAATGPVRRGGSYQEAAAGFGGGWAVADSGGSGEREPEVPDPAQVRIHWTGACIRSIAVVNVATGAVYLWWRVTRSMTELHYPVWSWILFGGECVLACGVWSSHLMRIFPAIRNWCTMDELVAADPSLGARATVAVLVPTAGEKLRALKQVMLGACSQRMWPSAEEKARQLRVCVLDEKGRPEVLEMVELVYTLAGALAEPDVQRELSQKLEEPWVSPKIWMDIFVQFDGLDRFIFSSRCQKLFEISWAVEQLSTYTAPKAPAKPVKGGDHRGGTSAGCAGGGVTSGGDGGGTGNSGGPWQLPRFQQQRQPPPPLKRVSSSSGAKGRGAQTGRDKRGGGGGAGDSSGEASGTGRTGDGGVGRIGTASSFHGGMTNSMMSSGGSGSRWFRSWAGRTAGERLEKGFVKIFDQNRDLPSFAYLARKDSGMPKRSPKAGNLNAGILCSGPPGTPPVIGDAKIVLVNDARHRIKPECLQRTVPYFFRRGAAAVVALDAEAGRAGVGGARREAGNCRGGTESPEEGVGGAAASASHSRSSVYSSRSKLSGGATASRSSDNDTGGIVDGSSLGGGGFVGGGGGASERYEWANVAFVQVPQRFEDLKDGDPLANHASMNYQVSNVGKDGVGAVTSCGQGSLWRVDALSGYAPDGATRVTPDPAVHRELIGHECGFLAEVLIEDTHTSLALFTRGWRSAYVCEPGEALAICVDPPNTVEWRIKQIFRWHLGAVQLLFLHHIRYALARRMPTPLHRMVAFDTVSYFAQSLGGIIITAMPVVFCLTQTPPFSTVGLEFLIFFMPYMVTAMAPTTISMCWKHVDPDRVLVDEQFWIATCYVQFYALLIGFKDFVIRTSPENAWTKKCPTWPLPLLMGALGGACVYSTVVWILRGFTDPFIWFSSCGSGLLILHGFWPMGIRWLAENGLMPRAPSAFVRRLAFILIFVAGCGLLVAFAFNG